MNKNSQSGFGIVEVLLILVIIGIIGFTGWRVYEANREVSQTLVDSSTVIEKKKDATSQNYLTYSNEKYGYEFEYPKTWKTMSASDVSSLVYAAEHTSTVARTTDYADSNEGVGFHLTSGAMMWVRVEDVDASVATPDSYMALPKMSFMNKVVTAREKMAVDGYEALRFKLHYEGSPSLTTLLVVNKKVYHITFEYADDASIDKYKAEYEHLVQSFKLLD